MAVARITVSLGSRIATFGFLSRLTTMVLNFMFLIKVSTLIGDNEN